MPCRAAASGRRPQRPLSGRSEFWTRLDLFSCSSPIRAFNAARLVAFHATSRDSSEGIFVGKGGALTLIADTSGPFLSFKDSPASDDRGEVLFQADVNASDGNRISG